jgi:CBS domain-containing protein
MIVRDILKMKGDAVWSVEPGAPLAEAVRLMVEHDVGSVVVMQDGRMAGMLTFREVLRVIDGGGGALGASTAGEVMIAQPVVGQPGDTLDQVRQVMTSSHQRYLPVLDGERLAGVISFHDVARAALNAAQFENRLLKRYIKDWPEDGKQGGTTGA